MFTGLFQLDNLRRCWSRSKLFRWIMIVTVIYLFGRLAIQGLVLAQVWTAGSVASETTLISNDLHIYLDAANRLVNRQDLYRQEDLDKVAVFQYSPTYALFFMIFLSLPFGIVALSHTLLNVGAYILLYFWWGRIFLRLNLARARVMLAWTLPLWLIFAGFWGDLAYLNIYVVTALICTLLIEAIWEERLGGAVLWASLLLLSKPYLAFPLVIPFILGRWRFSFKLIGLSLLSQGVIIGGTILLMGPAYGWQQQVDYARFLVEMTHNFPWRGPESGFLGYNHSILQIMYYFLGVTPAALRLATGIKLLALIPLGLVGLRYVLVPVNKRRNAAPQLCLDLAFALYAGAFIWLDIVWEMTLGVVVFAYILATFNERWARILAWITFVPYALLDIWQVISFAALGPAIFADGLYIWTDPSIYLPMVMLVVVTFYALLIRRLWLAPVLSVSGTMEIRTEKMMHLITR